MTGLRSAVATGFRERYGRDPEGVWSAPGRVNLIGEHTDYNEGFVLPFAIDRRTWVAAARTGDPVLRVSSSRGEGVIELPLDALSPSSLEGWSAYPLGVVWALVDAGAVPSSGLSLHIESDVPLGAGLSSSAAIECATALAVDALWGLGHSRETLARIGQRAENLAVGAPTGIMDQSASLLGEEDAAVFLDCRSLVAEVVPLGLAEAGLVILVADSRVSHSHATGGYAARRASCEAGASGLGVAALRDVPESDLERAAAVLDEETFRRVRHIVTEDARVQQTVAVLREQGPLGIGALLVASHASMRDDFEISCPELDGIVEAALAAGAIGARMTGGGFGGAAIALVRSADAPSVTAAIIAQAERHGFPRPEVFPVVASAGARAEPSPG